MVIRQQDLRRQDDLLGRRQSIPSRLCFAACSLYYKHLSFENIIIGSSNSHIKQRSGIPYFASGLAVARQSNLKGQQTSSNVEQVLHVIMTLTACNFRYTMAVKLTLMSIIIASMLVLEAMGAAIDGLSSNKSIQRSKASMAKREVPSSHRLHERQNSHWKSQWEK